MLHSSELIMSVHDTLREYNIHNIVLDPVMVATSGDPLLQNDAVETLRDVLIPMARVITPNLPEAEILLGERIGSEADFPDAAKKLSQNGKVSVLLKAGHFDGSTLTDVFYNAEDDRIIELHSDRIDTINTHGTGCTLSSALASMLAKGLSLDNAVNAAKDYIHNAIAAGSEYKIGKGHGPVHHFHPFWK